MSYKLNYTFTPFSKLTAAERALYIKQTRKSADETEAQLLPKARELYFWDRHEKDQIIGKVDLSKA